MSSKVIFCHLLLFYPGLSTWPDWHPLIILLAGLRPAWGGESKRGHLALRQGTKSPAPTTVYVEQNPASGRYNSVYPGIPVPRCGHLGAAMVPGHGHRQVYREETRSAYARVAQMATYMGRLPWEKTCLTQNGLPAMPPMISLSPGGGMLIEFGGSAKANAFAAADAWRQILAFLSDWSSPDALS